MHDSDIKRIIDELFLENEISHADLTTILTALLGKECGPLHNYLFSMARLTSLNHFKKLIYKRALIEISNCCRNDCYYCGIRCSNKAIERYRLTPEEVVGACYKGYELGMRTFVLQGGEDPYYTSDDFLEIIHMIKKEFPDCALTLSLGEFDKEIYKKWFDAGADRYLLRHETANADHYAKIHPQGMTFEKRKECLLNLKEIGYQVGAGFMVGSPFQSIENIKDDIIFLKELKPQMVGIGPFIPHVNTVYKDCKAGEALDTMVILAIVRLILPNVLLPATTALNTIEEDGYEKGILAGANVVMINVTPRDKGKNYELYDGKVKVDCEDTLKEKELASRFSKIGYELTVSRGDHSDMREKNN